MKILFAAPDPWAHPIPYHIAPQRIVRACIRAGHTAFNLDRYGEPYSSVGLPPKDPNIVYESPLGFSTHATQERYLIMFEHVVKWFNPDLIYLFGLFGAGTCERSLAITQGIPLGIHKADPCWDEGLFPPKGDIRIYQKVDFITCNEGQMWNYLTQHGVNNAYLLSHAIDPELAPPINAEKRFLCSTVMGGEDPYRMNDLIDCYYKATDAFSEQTFISGGGVWNHMKWALNRKGEKRRYDALSPPIYNITKIHDYNCQTMPTKISPGILCHPFIHRLYSQSYYGFIPWGDYLRTGMLGKYNTRTFGTKTFEMGGSGAAMLSCRIADIEEVIIDGKTGFITDSTEDTVNAFQYAIDNPDVVKKMGEEAYRDIHKRHSWDVRYRDVLKPIFKELGLV